MWLCTGPALPAGSGSLGEESPVEPLASLSFCIPIIKSIPPTFSHRAYCHLNHVYRTNKGSFRKREHFSSLTAKPIKSSQRKVRQTRTHLPASNKGTAFPTLILPVLVLSLRKINQQEWQNFVETFYWRYSYFHFNWGWTFSYQFWELSNLRTPTLNMLLVAHLGKRQWIPTMSRPTVQDCTWPFQGGERWERRLWFCLQWH